MPKKKEITLPITLVGTRDQVYQALAELYSNIQYDKLKVHVVRNDELDIARPIKDK